ncbi:conserved hypothetical protein [Thermotomaculum hydrothermale]|uniref:Hfq-related domain-containing protein n=1 Tax=Thermotomaculum hydrothermale TaxID=981385 RepID=A0A7R6PNG5_9BACT|nr:hypothetical protein [Thermotomaculum hydrothermale]BBB33307.1 conserved hypothetical protein [Thermotomaculum hydrothermale]
MANRKLIRPSLQEIKSKMSEKKTETPSRIATQIQAEQPLLNHPLVTTARRKQSPPEQTHAENFYYLKQMQAKEPMVIILEDGEEIRGIIEWYDKNCLKVNRLNEPNLLIMKSKIKYMYKQEEERAAMRKAKRRARKASEKKEEKAEESTEE